jgi:hypothetical protein
MRSLLFQTFHVATYLMILLPSNEISAPSPHVALFGTTLSYAHLHVRLLHEPLYYCSPYTPPPLLSVCLPWLLSIMGIGALTFPRTTSVSRHVVFDESSFLFASLGTPLDLDFLFASSSVVPPIAPPYPSSIAGTPETPVVPWHRCPRPRLCPCSCPCLRHASSRLHAMPNPLVYW